MQKLYLFSNLKRNINEGGMARNFAFYKELNKRNAIIYNSYSMNKFYRLFAICKNLFLLYTLKNSKVVILQNTLVTYIFPIAFFGNSFLFNMIKIVFDRLLKRNSVYYEVNDLMYEQSIDLAIDINKNVVKFQDFIFSQRNLNFIFASHKMRDYVVEKYNLDFDKTQVIINGAPEADTNTQKDEGSKDDVLKFLYVGTLNQGREVDKLLKVFEKSKHQLYLMGQGGDWLKLEDYQNIFYLGSFPEHEALTMASNYDFGVVPYNDSKFYYNLCYPTKNSFYISAGLPILSTPLEESMEVLNQFGKKIAIFKDIEDWAITIEALTQTDLMNMKNNISIIKTNFIWDNLLSKLSLC